jgi:hypothetical protein
VRAGLDSVGVCRTIGREPDAARKGRPRSPEDTSRSLVADGEIEKLSGRSFACSSGTVRAGILFSIFRAVSATRVLRALPAADTDALASGTQPSSIRARSIEQKPSSLVLQSSRGSRPTRASGGHGSVGQPVFLDRTI